MNVYEFLNNRAVRIIVALVMVVCLTVVPFDFKIQQAKTAYAVAITGSVAICIIMSILMVMGASISGYYVSTASGNYYDSQAGYYTNNRFPKYYGSTNLWKLSKELFENCPVLREYIIITTSGFNTGTILSSVLLNVPKYIYNAIKEYLDNKYASETGSIAEGLANASELISIPETVMLQGFYCYPKSMFDIDGGTVPYDIVTYHPSDVRLVCTVDSGLYTPCDYTFSHDITVGSNNKYTVNIVGYDSTGNKSALTMSYSVVGYPQPQLLITYQDDALDELGTSVHVWAVEGGVIMARTFMGKTTFLEDEWDMAVKSIAGFTDITVDEEVYEDTEEYPPYVKVYDDLLEYEDLTMEDIASYTPVTADTESNIVNASAQTLTWTGEIEDCPIDDLEASLVALGLGATIGNWALKWADDTTMCDISCSDMATGETSVSISSDVAMTWADVLEKVGYNDIADTDTGVGEGTATGEGTIAGEATLDMPTSSIDLTPFYLTGDILTTRFPFSLPWDIYNAFTFFFKEEKTDKVIIIPLDMGVLGKHDVEFDLSPIFDSKVIMVSRYGLYVLFVLGLILATNKLIGRG